MPGLRREQAVGLGVVGLAVRDGGDELLQVGRLHLAVGRHHAGDVDLVGERALVAGDDRGADARVLLVLDDLDARIGVGGALDCGVGRVVVDDVDPVDERRNLRDGGADQLLLVVGRHDDRNCLAGKHAANSIGCRGFCL